MELTRESVTCKETVFGFIQLGSRLNTFVVSQEWTTPECQNNYGKAFCGRKRGWAGEGEMAR